MKELYLEAIATDIRNVLPPDALPDEEMTSLFLSYAVLLLAKGEAVTREDVHNAWVGWMASKGENHNSMVPFSDLPLKIQAEDSPFVSAIHAVARARKGASSG